MCEVDNDVIEYRESLFVEPCLGRRTNLDGTENGKSRIE
ncbi:unnamed protein product [Acidithrix sp. C25]|nr:unnamed protein product [Acidithrix sp. C25]